jgi:hypothetical protein
MSSAMSSAQAARQHDVEARQRRAVVTVHVHGEPDLAVVDLLARLQLLARRGLVDVRITGAEELLELVGLEALGEPEAREERRVEEVVDVDDLPR